MNLAVLSAGAAKGVVTALQGDFHAATGAVVDATFGAVGAMKEKLEAGEPCDVIILTAAMIDELSQHGQVIAETRAPLGRVRTGIAVRAGTLLPDIQDRASLGSALVNAPALYVPDPQRATAGIHFLNVLRKLGIEHEAAPRIKAFANGATAMRALADSDGQGEIGCTQITEIKYTPGVTLVGALPKEFELATIYVAAVSNRARDAVLARRFVDMVAGAASRTLREQGGFEP